MGSVLQRSKKGDFYPHLSDLPRDNSFGFFQQTLLLDFLKTNKKTESFPGLPHHLPCPALSQTLSVELNKREGQPLLQE